jgi:hypothetical protein
VFKLRRRAGILTAAILICLFFSSCGIYEYIYLNPVASGNITTELNTLATIGLPNFQGTEYRIFNHFIIYYRIYISGSNEAGKIQISQTNLSKINQTLSEDYFRFEPYTTSSSTAATSVAALFSGRNYYPLALENANIDDNVGILGRSSLGKTITLDFKEGSAPSVKIDNANYVLFRSNGNTSNDSFSPVPDRYFINKAELNRSENISSRQNKDVADNTAVSGPRYTYVSMYIVVNGTDDNFSPVFSTPTHIGIFRLPEPFY